MEEDFQISIALMLFFADTFFWFFSVFLINNVVSKKPLSSGFSSAALNFSNLLTVYYSVKNLDYMLPACFGAFVGAALATEYDRRKRNQEDVVEDSERSANKLKEGTKRIATVPKKVIKIS